MMNSSLNQLFVYGSLRSGFQHPAYTYISENFVLVGSARVKGKLYDLGEYPAAIPASDDSYILGELYQLKDDYDFSWVIEQIDDYEGLNVEEGEQTLFKREIVDVYLDAEATTAWVYWYNNEIINKPMILSGDILEYIQQKK